MVPSAAMLGASAPRGAAGAAMAGAGAVSRAAVKPTAPPMVPATIATRAAPVMARATLPPVPPDFPWRPAEAYGALEYCGAPYWLAQ